MVVVAVSMTPPLGLYDVASFREMPTLTVKEMPLSSDIKSPTVKEPFVVVAGSLILTLSELKSCSSLAVGFSVPALVIVFESLRFFVFNKSLDIATSTNPVLVVVTSPSSSSSS
uniref:Uncharacterized protein n=1 Tax=Cacopsylla melanoneura TaxID=428564 RepID=A0A8D8ZBW4_9HEMI